MVVEHRIFRPQRHRAFQLACRFFITAKPVMRPAKRIDDVAIIGAQLDRALDELHPLFQLHVHVDPGIAQIVQNLRLVGIKLQRLEEIRLRLLPLFQPLIGDAALVEEAPVLAFRLFDTLDRAVIDLRRRCIILLHRIDAAQRQIGANVVGILLDCRIEKGLRLFMTVEIGPADADATSLSKASKAFSASSFMPFCILISAS